jgi:hypothetical protein
LGSCRCSPKPRELYAPNSSDAVSVFVLVHGAFHGAWCWSLLVQDLEEMGHCAVTMDLPIDDPNAEWHDHVRAVMDVAPTGPDAIVVGHSRAGRLLPLLLERGSFARAVYLCASIPKTMQNLPRRCDQLPMLAGTGPPLERDELGRDVCTRERADAVYYSDCPPDLRDWAFPQLRPQCEVDYPLVRDWPSTPSRYIACRDDRAVNIQWMRAAPREVFGQPALELPGGHAPFLSRPRHLAAVLSGL